MIIKEIELNNFRIYKGLNKIDLSISDEENIIIISGKNGYGKTTFLMSLVWCLYGRQMGDVDELYKKEIEDNGGYRTYIANSLNKQAQREGKTTFSVSVTFADVDIPDITCDELKITRTYYTEGNKDDELTILIGGDKNELVDEVGAETFIRDFIMPKEIAKFFFFDAEKIVSLAEIHTPEQRKNLSTAYAEVLRIKQYQDLRADLYNYLTDLKSKTATTREKDNLSRIRAEVGIAENRIAENKNKIDELNEQASALSYDINKLQEKLIKHGSSITVEELNQLKERKKGIDEEVNQIRAELKTNYEIIPFAISGDLLTQVFEQVSAERNYLNREFDKDKAEKVSDDIINDLMNIEKPKDLTIHYKIQEFYIDTVKDLLAKHLDNSSQKNMEEVEILHNYSEVEKTELEQFISNIKNSFREKLKNIVYQYNKSKNEANEIDKKVRKAEENATSPLVQGDRDNKHKLENQRNDIQQKIGVLKNEIEENENNLIQYKKDIDKITDKLNLSKDNESIGKEVEKTIKVLDGFITEFKQDKSQSLSEKIMEGLDTLLHKKDFVKNVKVDIINDEVYIELLDKNDSEIKTDTLSKGEQQMYATALLKGLVDESNIEFPVFIDSPMQKFDVDHSHSIVKYFYPKVSKQVIIFPLLKKEMSKEEFDILTPKINKTYLIVNENNEKSSFEEVNPKEELFNNFEKYHQNAN